MDAGLELIKAHYPEDRAAIERVRYLLIGKSCLLDRLIYHGEHPSQTPCPIHKGKWSGCHFAWPGAEWVHIADGSRSPADVDPLLQQWHDAGCRCYQHKCGCTTGWQPDESCGCLDA